MITVEGRKVGYMYREEPDNDVDSGWRFMSGWESQAYMDDAANHAVFDVNTIANYDADIVPYLDAPSGSAFERQDRPSRFAQVDGDPWEPNRQEAGSGKVWPPPGFPLVEGDQTLTATWPLQLPEPFARRVDEGGLVLWRPGLTVWFTAWSNDHNESQAERLEWIRRSASSERFGERESKSDVTRFSYRLRDKNEHGSVESLSAYIISDDGHMQMSVYFDDPGDEPTAWKLVDSVVQRE